MFIHFMKSKEARDFLKNRNLFISKDSSHNAVTLVDGYSGKTLTLWAESDYSVAAGIPGIYVEE